MCVKFWNAFTKITGWPVQKIIFNTDIIYEDKEAQGRFVKGPAIIVSNHTSVFDYAVYLFVFRKNILRTQIAELQFEKPLLGRFLKALGGIYVDRNKFDFSFIEKSEAILKDKGTVLVFPEGRIPLENEGRPLEFKSSTAYIALSSNVPVVPVYTDGNYFHGKHPKVVIGKAMNFDKYLESDLSDKEIIEMVTREMREKIISLEELVNV